MDWNAARRASSSPPIFNSPWNFQLVPPQYLQSPGTVLDNSTTIIHSSDKRTRHTVAVCPTNLPVDSKHSTMDNRFTTWVPRHLPFSLLRQCVSQDSGNAGYLPTRRPKYPATQSAVTSTITPQQRLSLCHPTPSSAITTNTRTVPTTAVYRGPAMLPHTALLLYQVRRKRHDTAHTRQSPHNAITPTSVAQNDFVGLLFHKK